MDKKSLNTILTTRTAGHHRRGSALIITLLIVSIISSISVAVTTLTISEFRKASALQDSISAFYAAESGLEHGLMQYRLWHDVELSDEFYRGVHGVAQSDGSIKATYDTSIIPTSSQSSHPQLFQLSGAADEAPHFLADTIPSISDLVYSLKMWFRDDRIGDVDGNGRPVVGPDSQRIYRDSALQLAIPQGAKTFSISWLPVGENTTQVLDPNPAHYFIELDVSGVNASQQPVTQRSVCTDEGIKVSQCSMTDYSPIEFNTLSFVPQRLRIKPWGMDSVKYSLRFYDINDRPLYFDTQYTNIESTGQVGSVKRKLSFKIHRASGTILEGNDFLLLTGGGDINITR